MMNEDTIQKEVDRLRDTLATCSEYVVRDVLDALAEAQKALAQMRACKRGA